jgi:hypothetical protein
MIKQPMATLIALTALGLALPAALSASDRAHRPAAAAQATLHVTNNNPQPVFVVLIDERPDGWAQWPLGTIDKDATRTFRLNSDVVGLPHIRIVASAFSNWKEYESKPLTLRRGRELDLTLNNPEPSSLLASR